MKEKLSQILSEIIADLDGAPDQFEVAFQEPASKDHGDLATNSALRLAKDLKKSPRDIATLLIEKINERLGEGSGIGKVEIAGPGFINFHFSEDHLESGVLSILANKENFGRSEVGKGKTAMVEYVSANPTGPLTVGHGRNAVLGDTYANMLTWLGYDVTREYYFNDAGRQMRVLRDSVLARALFIQNPNGPTKDLEKDGGEIIQVPESFPEGGYQGEYIIEIADQFIKANPDLDLSDFEPILDAPIDTTSKDPIKEYTKEKIFAEIEKTLLRLGIKMDGFFNEQDVYDDGSMWKILDTLREKGEAYDKDGAVWFKTTNHGKDSDTVLVKSSGEPTYRLPDIAYHANKIDRGFDVIVDIFGADHIATYPDVMTGLEVLGYDASKIDVTLYQFVTLIRGGKPIKMSTRKATYVTLDELMDEVGEDVTRFFFLMRSPGTHLEFDLDLAKEAKDKNPVFYLQYAHARICSIVRKTEELGISFSDTPNLTLLVHERENELTRDLLSFPNVIKNSFEQKAPHRLIAYLNDVATSFSKFYDQCRIIGEEEELATARMHLAEATRVVLNNGLKVIGISAPEKM